MFADKEKGKERKKETVNDISAACLWACEDNKVDLYRALL